MLPYFTSLEHPQQSIITKVAHVLYKANRELQGDSQWSYLRTDNPMDNLEYRASILETIGTDLQNAEDCIAQIKDEDTRSALMLWFSLVFKVFSDRYLEHSKVGEGLVD